MILPATPLPMIRFRKSSVLMLLLRFVVRGLCRGPLAGVPRLAERPERDPEESQILDEELSRERRQGREAPETRFPHTRSRDEEAQGREEHPDRQGAAQRGNP